MIENLYLLCLIVLLPKKVLACKAEASKCCTICDLINISPVYNAENV